MRSFRSDEEFSVEGRGQIKTVKVVGGNNLYNLTFGELERIIKEGESISLDGKLEVILGYEYPAICRGPNDYVTMDIGLLI